MTANSIPTPPGSTPSPRDLLDRAAKRYPLQADLARRLGIPQLLVSRLRRGVAPFRAELSVRLADALGEDRAFVLRVCGHGDLAALIYSSGNPERSREPGAIDPLTTDDRRLIQTLIDRLRYLLGNSPATVPDDAPKGGAR